MNFHVRPRNILDSRNDGSSYANAWKGLERIQWEKVNPGDTILAHGKHYPNGRGYVEFPVKKSGVPGNSITIMGADVGVEFYQHYLAADGQHNFTLKNLSFIDSGQIRSAGSTNVTLTGLTCSRLSKDAERFIELGKGNHDWLIEWCLIEYCKNAIYTLIGEGDPAQRLTVRDTWIRNVANNGWDDTKDGHCVGVQGGSGHKVQRCVFRSSGTSVCFWAPGIVEMKKMLVEDCNILWCRPLQGSGSGIEISGSYDVALNQPEPGWRSGIVIRNNVISHVEGYGISTNIRDHLVLENNRITDFGKGEIRQFNPFTQEV